MTRQSSQLASSPTTRESLCLCSWSANLTRLNLTTNMLLSLSYSTLNTYLRASFLTSCMNSLLTQAGPCRFPSISHSSEWALPGLFTSL